MREGKSRDSRSLRDHRVAAVAATFVVLLVGAALAYHWLNEVPALERAPAALSIGNDVELRQPSAEAANDTVATETRDRKAGVAPAETARDKPANGPEVAALIAEFGRWNARSQEDAEWLRENWYPSSSDDPAGVSTPTPIDLPEDLIPRSARDLVVAESLLPNEAYRDDAIATLRRGAADGAGYAWFALGLYHESIAPLDALVFFRAAVMSGDWMAALRPKMPLPDSADTFATLMALKLLQDVDLQRAESGLPPLPRRVRPGLDDAVLFFLVQMEQERQQAPQ
jgi:hypothetical protein